MKRDQGLQEYPSGPKRAKRSRRALGGWAIAGFMVIFILGGAALVVLVPAPLLEHWLPSNVTGDERNALIRSLLGSAAQIVLFGLGGLIAVAGVGLSLSRHRVSLERLDDDRERELRARFVTAVGLLSDPEKSTTRQAGMYALAALADDWVTFGNVDERDVCIEVICGYLRSGWKPDKKATAEDERRVRATGFNLIASHLRPGSASWDGAKFNLRKAVINFDVDASNIRVTKSTIDFDEATFSGGKVDFRGATFSGGNLSFFRATFSRGNVDFHDATFSGGKVSFIGATFSGGNLSFFRATFSGGDVYLSGGDVSFIGATFSGGSVSFNSATFSGGDVSFYGATFSGGDVSFNSATFSGGSVSFDTATLSGGSVSFNSATFSGGEVSFGSATGSDEWKLLSPATFSGSEVSFGRATFAAECKVFFGAMFSGGNLSFFRATFSGGTFGFNDARFAGTVFDYIEANFGGTLTHTGEVFEGFPEDKPEKTAIEHDEGNLEDPSQTEEGAGG